MPAIFEYVLTCDTRHIGEKQIIGLEATLRWLLYARNSETSTVGQEVLGQSVGVEGRSYLGLSSCYRQAPVFGMGCPV